MQRSVVKGRDPWFGYLRRALLAVAVALAGVALLAVALVGYWSTLPVGPSSCAGIGNCPPPPSPAPTPLFWLMTEVSADLMVVGVVSLLLFWRFQRGLLMPTPTAG